MPGNVENQGNDLEKIAEAGRRLAAQQETARKEQAAGELQEKSRAAERVRLRSVSAYARWGWIPVCVLIVVGMGVVYESTPDAAKPEYEADPTGALLMAVCGVLIALTYFLRPAFGRRALRREKEWLLGLPFQLSGYLACLTHSPRDGRAEASLSFRGSLPDAEILANVLRTVDADAKPSGINGGAARVVATRYFSFEGAVLTNAHIRRWVHDLVERCLVLHASYPIAEIEITLSW